MSRPLNDAQAQRFAEFEAFAAQHVAPQAAAWDRAQAIPRAALAALGAAGYFGVTLSREHGGQGWDAVTFGLLNESLGRFDSAFTDYVTVQAMVAMTLAKWGTTDQKREWLPALARGEKLGAFALTEPGGGSDLTAMNTQFIRTSDGLTLRGEKKWISGGQLADIFLVFGKLGDLPLACLVPRDAVSLEIEPITDLLGFRAAGLAQLRFRDVRVPDTALVGKPGFAFSHVAPVGLHYGRISTACSACGLLRGCFEESTAYSSRRTLSGRAIGDMGMIQTLIARMGTDLEAARLLCWAACRSEDEHSPESFTQVMTAKYFASRAAVRAAADAIQVHGAAGCHESSPIARYFRASKIMEIIEGTTQVHERILGETWVKQAK